MNNYVFNPISGEVSAKTQEDNLVSAVNLIKQGGTDTDTNTSKAASSDTYGDFLPNASDSASESRQPSARTAKKSDERNRQVKITDTKNSSEDNSESGDNSENCKNDNGGGENHDKAVTTKSGEKLIKTIVIAGQIEGHSQLPQGQKATRYEELIPQLVEIEENDEIGGLLIILNTVGGDVEAGLALSELIVGMKKPTASLVLGGGHSIGVPLAVSAKRSFIVPSATMTLHPVRITGMILGAPQTYVYLSRMQERIIDFTCSHCNMSPERFNELMLSRDEMSTDLGSVLDGGQAVSEGLIDSLGTLSDAIEFIKSSM